MKKLRYLILVLPLLHLIACLVVAHSPGESSWKWFPIFLLDRPFSDLLLQLHQFPPVLVYGIGGTFWWLFLSAVVALIIKMLIYVIRRLRTSGAR